MIHVDDVLKAHTGLHLGAILTAPNCDTLAAQIRAAQITERTDDKTSRTDQQAREVAHKALRGAQSKDTAALNTRTTAIASAQSTYLGVVALDNEADEATETGVPDTADTNIASALGVRDGKITAANNDYQAGGTAAALVSAQQTANAADARCNGTDALADRNELALIAQLELDLRNCRTPVPPTTTTLPPPPPPVTTTAPPVILPGPVPQGPTTFIPGPVVQGPSQIGQAPVGAVPTGAMTEDARYLG